MTHRWTGANAFRDHANDRVIEPGEELPEDVAEQIAAVHPHQVETIDTEAEEAEADADTETSDDATSGAADTPPIDPDEHTVSELKDALTEGDFSDAELDAIADAEAAGESRDTALDAIETARE